MRINHNVSAMRVQHSITQQSRRTNTQLGALSSGLRVRRAEDDASGVAISEGLRSQVAALSQNLRNTEQAANLLQVAEGGLAEVSDALIHMRELAVTAADGHLNEAQRQVAATEFHEVRSSIDRVGQATTYNGQAILAGSTRVVQDQSTALQQSARTGLAAVRLTGAQSGIYTIKDNASKETITLGNGVVTQTIAIGVQLDQGVTAAGTRLRVSFDRLGVSLTLAGSQAGAVGSYAAGDLDGTTLKLESADNGSFLVGPDSREFNQLNLKLPDMRASRDPLGLGPTSISSQGSARQALTTIDRAIRRVATERITIGSLQNRMAFSKSFSAIELVSMSGSESSIRDADVAAETTRYSRSMILSNSSSAMLVQAFDTTRQMLQLL
jgi:flagellin